MTLFAATSLALIALSSLAQSAPMLDGESASPANERQSYEFTCPGNVIYRITLSRQRAGPVRLSELREFGRSVGPAETAKVQPVLDRFLYVDSVTLRCTTGGGAKFLLGGKGKTRQAPTSGRAAFGLVISAKGIVSIER